MSGKYQSGEEPHVGDRVIGIMSGRHAVVVDLLNDTGTTRNIVVTYDDRTIPLRQDANSLMYALVERAKVAGAKVAGGYANGEEPQAGDTIEGLHTGRVGVVTAIPSRGNRILADLGRGPESITAFENFRLVKRAAPVEQPVELLRQWHEGEHVEAFGRAYRVVGYDGESDRYELATLGADGEPDGTKSSSGTNFFATAEVMRDAQAIARYHEGDTVSVPGRRGFAKVIGYGEVTKQSGVRVRIQWDGAGVTEFVPERELRLVAKGVPKTMFGKSDVERRLTNAEESLNTVDDDMTALESSVEEVKEDVSALWDFSRQTAAEHGKTRERVGKIEAREGSGSAGLNALSSTIGNVERELVRLHDKVNGAASSSALHVLRGTVGEIRDELRTDLALLAKAQLRSMGIALHGELDPVESLRYAVQNGVWLPYGHATEISTAQGQLGTLTRYDSVQAAESSADSTRGVTPASVGDMAKALTRLRECEQAILDLKNRVGRNEAAIYDGDDEYYFGGLVDSVEGIERELQGKASADSLASAWREIGNLGGKKSNLLPFGESSLLYKRLSAVEHELAKHGELVDQLREQAGIVVENHPALGERIVELERRFNRSQARAKSLRNGPQSYDKRLAALEQATASLIQNAQPPMFGAERAREGVVYSPLYKSDREQIGAIERDLTRVVGIVTKEQASKLGALADENRDLRERMLRLEAMTKGLVNVVTSQNGEIAELRQAQSATDELARDAYQAAAAVRERLGRYIEQNGGDAITRMVDEMNRQVWSDDFDPNKVKTLLDDAVRSARGIVTEDEFGTDDASGWSSAPDGVRVEETDDGTVVVDVIFCVQDHRAAWECLHKNEKPERDFVEPSDSYPYETWRPCNVPGCDICRVNREHRAANGGTFARDGV